MFLIYMLLKKERRQALYRLCRLNRNKIKTYFDSYQKIFNDQTMISTLDDFNNQISPARFIIPEKDKIPEYTADCYCILNDLCTLGNVKKMYIPKLIDAQKSLIENQILYEQEVAKKLNVKPGGKILEIGCGCGRIAYHMSQETKSQVYGINIDQKQLDDAIHFTKQKNSNNQFIFQDLNGRYPYPDNNFDAIYEFAAFTSFINDYDGVFGEIYRVLKPGGIFFITDAVLLDNFDKNNPHHLKLISSSRMVMAGGVFLHYKYFEEIAQRNGFKIILSRGGEAPNLATDLPMLKREHQNYQKIENKIKLLSKFHLIPRHMVDLIERLRYGGNDLVEMEENNLLTMTWEFYFQKP